MQTEAPTANENSHYTVVARRYRPKSFQELIGQNHISTALEKAIASGRVGHAYLFTGARGVGKTSTARIFAKALNLPSAGEQDSAGDIAQAIDAGEDMDVIEIDGASNRGIEEIRQLRANVNVRPSRSTYKIYIIDEVHMLTNQAFNALLKTLEEPPPHVKFIFCTTDPDKIPITVLSRCQRFDFAPVRLEAIQDRLKEICQCEGYAADDEALALLARRAAGSMRDSQSLLEQVMSFSTDIISVEQVHTLLGTADESRLQALVEAMVAKDPLQAVGLVDEAIRSGADAGQVAEQLLGFLRDIMTVGIGGGPELLKLANPMSHSKLAVITETWGTQTVLSAIQILDESLVRMRSSVSAVTLLEVALVQICQLEQLASIPALLERLASQRPSQAPVQPAEKKKPESPVIPESKLRSATAREPLAIASGVTGNVAAEEPETFKPNRTAGDDFVAASDSGSVPASEGTPTALASKGPADRVDTAGRPEVAPTQSEASTALEADKPEGATAMTLASTDALEQWRSALKAIDGLLGDYAGLAALVEPTGSDHWKIVFPPGGMQLREYCEQPDRKVQLQSLLREHLGRTVQLSFAVQQGEIARPKAAISQAALRAQKLREMAEHPYVKRLCEVLDGEILRVDPGP